jgi:hypothetical protein
MVVMEALYTMDARMHGHGVYMAVKLDISKVYDIVEWNFLKEVTRKIGFADIWDFFYFELCPNFDLFGACQWTTLWKDHTH